MSLGVERHSAHGIVSSKRKIALAGGRFGLGFGKAMSFAIDYKLVVVDQFDAEPRNELFRAFGDEVHMRAFAQYKPRRPNGIADAFHASHAACSQGSAIHDERIHLDFSVSGEETTASSVEGFVILHHHHGFFHGLERGASRGEYLPSDSQSVLHAAAMVLDNVVRHRPRPAMHY